MKKINDFIIIIIIIINITLDTMERRSNENTPIQAHVSELYGHLSII